MAWFKHNWWWIWPITFIAGITIYRLYKDAGSDQPRGVLYTLFPIFDPERRRERIPPRTGLIWLFGVFILIISQPLSRFFNWLAAL